MLCVVACGPTGVPGAVGPGRCVCRWAAARPRAFRAASFARRVVSKPGQTPPPPTGTVAGPSGALHTSGTWSLCVPVGGGPPASRPRCELRSARRLEARPDPAQRHRSVTRRPQVSCPALACRIAEPTTNIACNSPATLSNHEFTVLELQHFQTLLKLHPIELHAELGEFPFPWLSLCLRGIALHRWAMHRLLASALLCYLVHWCCI